MKSDIAVPGSHPASQMLMATLSLAPVASTFLADAESFILQSDTVSPWCHCGYDTTQLMPSAFLLEETHMPITHGLCRCATFWQGLVPEQWLKL